MQDTTDQQIRRAGASTTDINTENNLLFTEKEAFEVWQVFHKGRAPGLDSIDTHMIQGSWEIICKIYTNFLTPV